MLYVGPSTRAAAELRSLRAGSTLSDTTAADGGESRGTWGLGEPEDFAGSCRRESSRGDIKGVWEWMESAKVGAIGVESTSWM